MESKNIILIAIAVLVIILVGVGIYSMGSGHGDNNMTSLNDTNSTNNTTALNKTADNSTNKTVGDNSPRKNDTKINATYKIYNPQSDSYVTVIGEGYDDEVDRWYTYDTDGVRYYNTRIK